MFKKISPAGVSIVLVVTYDDLRSRNCCTELFCSISAVFLALLSTSPLLRL